MAYLTLDINSPELALPTRLKLEPGFADTCILKTINFPLLRLLGLRMTNNKFQFQIPNVLKKAKFLNSRKIF